MVQTNIGHHHREKSMQHWLDKLVYIFGMLGPFFVIPQVWKIYAEQNASSISLFTWTAGGIPQLIWLSWGVVHNERPVVVLNVFWLAIYLFMAIGKILY